MIDQAAIRLRWDAVGSRLDERGRRLYLSSHHLDLTRTYLGAQTIRNHFAEEHLRWDYYAKKLPHLGTASLASWSGIPSG